METRVLHYTIESKSEVLSSYQQLPGSKKRIKGPRVLNRAYIKQVKEKIATKEAEKTKKAADRKERKKQQEAGEKKQQEIESRVDQALHGEEAGWKQKYKRKGADLKRLGDAMSFLLILGNLIL